MILLRNWPQSWLKLMLIWVFGMNANFSGAQHCAFDFYRIFGVVPFWGDTQNVVKGLTIQLVFHTKDLPITQQQVEDENYNPVFNIPTTKHPGYFERKTATLGGEFEFAKKHYSCVYHHRQSRPQKYYVLIKDTDGGRNGGDFGNRIIELNTMGTNNDVAMSLCGSSYKDKSAMHNYSPLYVDMNQLINVGVDVVENCGTQYEQWIFQEDSWLVQNRKNRCSEINYTYAKQLKWICVKEQHCYHVFPNSERIDCVISEFKDGQWVESQRIHGCE